jgi:hypothetical protein
MPKLASTYGRRRNYEIIRRTFEICGVYYRREGPWTLSTHATVPERFSQTPRSNHLAGGDSMVPSPDSGRSVGGWGIPGSRRVCSVGSSRLPAGSVEELVARLEWFFEAVVILFGGGAPLWIGHLVHPRNSSELICVPFHVCIS